MDPPPVPAPPPAPTTAYPVSLMTPETNPLSTKTPATTTTSRRGIQGEKWTPAEEHRLRNLWQEFQGRSASRYAVEIWLPISERMPGRKPDACHQKAYRMGLLSEKAGKETGAGKRASVGAGTGKRKERASIGGPSGGVVAFGGAGDEAPPAAKVRKQQQRHSLNGPPTVDARKNVIADANGGDAMLGVEMSKLGLGIGTGTGPALIFPLNEPSSGSEDEDSTVPPPGGWVTSSSPEDAWKHDRDSARGKSWRAERHKARKVWAGGMHARNMDRFCPSVCEMCALKRRSVARRHTRC